jgi:hypothetical protein
MGALHAGTPMDTRGSGGLPLAAACTPQVPSRARHSECLGCCKRYVRATRRAPLWGIQIASVAPCVRRAAERLSEGTESAARAAHLDRWQIARPARRIISPLGLDPSGVETLQ